MKDKYRVYFLTFPIVWIIVSVLWFWFKDIPENMVQSLAILAIYYLVMSIMHYFDLRKHTNQTDN